jgi:hypothetical protein
MQPQAFLLKHKGKKYSSLRQGIIKSSWYSGFVSFCKAWTQCLHALCVSNNWVPIQFLMQPATSTEHSKSAGGGGPLLKPEAYYHKVTNWRTQSIYTCPIYHRLVLTLTSHSHQDLPVSPLLSDFQLNQAGILISPKVHGMGRLPIPWVHYPYHTPWFHHHNVWW